MDLDAVLKRSVFGSVEASVRREILASCTRQSFAARDPVIVEGQASRHVFVLLSGAVRVFHLAPSGLELVVMFCRAPAVFGEIEAVLRMQHIEFVSTMDASDMLLVPNEVFLRCLDRHPAFGRTMVADVCSKLAMASHNQKALAFQDLAMRLATLLVSYAMFDGKQTVDGVMIQLPITQDDMAQALGVTRRGVSKVITHWIDDGLISRRQSRYVLHRMDQLTELAAVEHIGLTYARPTGLTIVQPPFPVAASG